MVSTFLLYSTTLISITLLARQSDSKRNDKMTISTFFIITLLSLLSGFRSCYVGNDSYEYAVNFVEGDGRVSFEIGFIFFLKLLRKMSDSYSTLFFVCAFFTNYLFVTRLSSLKEEFPLRYSIPLYYSMMYFLGFSAIRQFLATAIVFYSSKYVLEDTKVFKFLIGVAIACLFHFSAIIAIIYLFPIVFDKKLSRRYQWIKASILILSPVIIYLVALIINKRYSLYFNYRKTEWEYGLMMPLRFVLLLLIIVNDKRCHRLDTPRDILSFLYFFEFLAILFSSFDYFFDNIGRIKTFFLCFTPVLYSYEFKIRKKDVLSISIKLLIMLILIYQYWNIFSSFSTKIVPYYFFWQS